MMARLFFSWALAGAAKKHNESTTPTNVIARFISSSSGRRGKHKTPPRADARHFNAQPTPCQDACCGELVQSPLDSSFEDGPIMPPSNEGATRKTRREVDCEV